MGHDTTAYKEVAYLRRNAFSDENLLIYQLLDVDDEYGGVSGYGSYRYFSKEDIQKALERTTDKTPPDIKKFLQVCAKEKYVKIHFG